MANFGWSYPPGCDGPPFDEPDGCEMCLKECDSCICPVCPVCQTQGDPKCYKEHGMSETPEQIASRREHEVAHGEPKLICDVDMDDATYVGDGIDGCYFDVAEGPGGWYVSVVVDSETGSFVDSLVTDEGPYETEEKARTVGRDAALSWCVENEVNPYVEVRVTFNPEATEEEKRSITWQGRNLMDCEWDEDDTGATLLFDTEDDARLAIKTINANCGGRVSARIVNPGETTNAE